MRDDSSTNLSFILNETSIHDIKKEPRSNSKNFYYSIFIIILIYTSTIYFSEIKSFYNNFLDTYILLKKKENISKIDTTKIQEVIKKDNYVSTEKNSISKVKQLELEINKHKADDDLIEQIEKKVLNKNYTTEKYEISNLQNQRKNFLEIYDSKDFKVFQCDNYKINKYQLVNACKLDLEKFLNNNKDAIKFEVIAILGENDVKYYSKYKNYLEEILMLGISTKRVQGMILKMKTHLEKGVIIPNVNYIKSDKNTSSVKVKAYY